jgi:hypothetical protein
MQWADSEERDGWATRVTAALLFVVLVIAVLWLLA